MVHARERIAGPFKIFGLNSIQRERDRPLGYIEWIGYGTSPHTGNLSRRVFQTFSPRPTYDGRKQRRFTLVPKIIGLEQKRTEDSEKPMKFVGHVRERRKTAVTFLTG